VSDAVPGASGRVAASRAATITIWRRELPARRPITFTSRRSACVKRWITGRDPPPPPKPRVANASATSMAVARSPGDPARRSGWSVAIRVAS
jgi:hypothetical protein